MSGDVVGHGASKPPGTGIPNKNNQNYTSFQQTAVVGNSFVKPINTLPASNNSLQQRKDSLSKINSSKDIVDDRMSTDLKTNAQNNSIFSQ